MNNYVIKNFIAGIPDTGLALFAAIGFFVIAIMLICGVIAILGTCWEWFLDQITCPECKRRQVIGYNDVPQPERDQDLDIRAKY